MKPPFGPATGPSGHALAPKVVGPSADRRLVCVAKTCGEPIVGAVQGLTSWIGGVHESDFEAGRFVELTWPDGAA